MPWEIMRFNRYSTSLYSGAQGDTEARIRCYDGDRHLGDISFQPDGTVRANRMVAGRPELHFPLSQYNDVITTLRYEKPLHLMINTTALYGYVSTEKEPVGEEET